MELGVATASADANGLRPLPPFPPVAQRWTFIDVLSSRTSAAGPPTLARAWNTSVHTPLAAQRTSGCRASCAGRGRPEHLSSGNQIAARGRCR